MERTVRRQGAGVRDPAEPAVQARAAVAHLRRAVRDAEVRIETLTRQRNELEARLADPAVYDGPTAALQDLQVRFGEIKRALTEAENAWLDAQAAADTAADDR